MGTHVGVPFRILTGIFVLVLGPTASITSTSAISLSTRPTEPTHCRVSGGSILRSRDHILAFIAEDLEGAVEDRSKLGEYPKRIITRQIGPNLAVKDTRICSKARLHGSLSGLLIRCCLATSNQILASTRFSVPIQRLDHDSRHQESRDRSD